MSVSITSPMPGIVTQILAEAGQSVAVGQDLVIVEAMKMENAIPAPSSGIVKSVHIKIGDLLEQGELLFVIEKSESTVQHDNQPIPEEVAQQPVALTELRARRKFLADESRPKAVEKRRSKGRLTARESVAMLTDPDSFKEYGSLIIAAQRSRRSLEDLVENTPADGLIAGAATINGETATSHDKAIVMAYDYTVLAGTQGTMNHMKMDRMLRVAHSRNLPVVLFAEGGGGRPGDVDTNAIAGLFVPTFTQYAALRDKVPTIAIVTGYCFAGNAALAGSSDLLIGTEDSSIGMGGPAMISGGGLGDFHPKEVGPSSVQRANGVIDILTKDDKEAISVARSYLSFFQGRTKSWTAPNQEELQSFIPTDRKRTFDAKHLITSICDEGSVLIIQEDYAPGLITCIGRVEGQAIAILANDCRYDAGAITADCARKAASMLDRCHRYSLPVLSLVDTPGIMVGPDAEKDGTVKAAGELFVAGARLQTPMMSIVVRRAYGLGAMAMMGGSTHQPTATVAWPSGEFGAMGLEGAVRLGYRKELEAIDDPEARQTEFDRMVQEAYDRGKAISAATIFEIDEVIECDN